ncbi:Cytochrome c6 [Planctomycetes bacterium Poly30]|uniref:Cytochrome c6 n=1 Tax=Saltatorellus ferox TaxID=2528018 RepID=A0A518EZ39_9BACT|nr:Cytochrome c6 [Planctomycetes bacterium Poly30]
MIATLCVTFLMAPGGPVASPWSPPELASDARSLYMANCASCHGETGDGKGTADLDRPARSFLDGGYSYGNTEKAVVRSIVHGIPGTPMPAFGETLAEDQIQALANYVIALGPPGTVVAPGSSVLSVGERPLVVHGMMPALAEGGRREPRSLVVGFPNGTTFQYRAQTGELQAIRQGDFLDRRDWGGRGGTELQPLGQVTWKPEPIEGGSNGQFNAMNGDTPLRRSFKGSRVADNQVWLNFDLVDADGKDVGGGQEFITFLMVDGVPVAMRSCLANGSAKGLRIDVSGGEPVTELTFPDSDPAVPTFTVTRPCPGLFAMTFENGTPVFVHAAEWTESLESAIRADITGATRGDR